MLHCTGGNSFLYGGSRIYSTDATQMGRDLLSVEEEYGASNPLVIMVPKGDTSKESALSEELKDNENVTSVISYVDSVGSTIPGRLCSVGFTFTALFRELQPFCSDYKH